jgi:ketosteroid isomerase-like protein
MDNVGQERSGAEKELRQLVLERVEAVRAKDPNPLDASQAEDVVTFEVIPPLVSHGKDIGREATRRWFDSYDGPIGYEVRDLGIVAEGDVGFCWFVYHVTGTTVAGTEVSMWVRATLGCRRIGGRWVIVHDHESVPFDPETGEALIGLAP